MPNKEKSPHNRMSSFADSFHNAFLIPHDFLNFLCPRTANVIIRCKALNITKIIAKLFGSFNFI